MLADIALGQAVAQPVLGGPHQLHLERFEAYLFLQFPVHSLLGGLGLLDATLGKLPGVLANTPPPEQAPLLVAEYNAYVGSKSFGIDQFATPKTTDCPGTVVPP